MGEITITGEGKQRKLFYGTTVIWREIRDIYSDIAKRYNVSLSDLLSILLITAAEDKPLMFYALTNYYGLSNEIANEIIEDLNKAIDTFLENAAREEGEKEDD